MAPRDRRGGVGRGGAVGRARGGSGASPCGRAIWIPRTILAPDSGVAASLPRTTALCGCGAAATAFEPPRGGARVTTTIVARTVHSGRKQAKMMTDDIEG